MKFEPFASSVDCVTRQRRQSIKSRCHPSRDVSFFFVCVCAGRRRRESRKKRVHPAEISDCRTREEMKRSLIAATAWAFVHFCRLFGRHCPSLWCWWIRFGCIRRALYPPTLVLLIAMQWTLDLIWTDPRIK